MFQLINMTAADIEVCSEIFIRAFSDDDSKCYDNEQFKKSVFSYFSQCIEGKDKYAVCLKKDDEIVAFMTGWNVPSLTGDYSIYIDLVAVSISHRRKGYGTEMIRLFCEKYEKGHTVRIDAEKDSPGYKLYKKSGFFDTGSVRMEKSEQINRLISEIDYLSGKITDISNMENGEEKAEQIKQVKDKIREILN